LLPLIARARQMSSLRPRAESCRIREKRGLTQEQFAEISDSVSNISAVSRSCARSASRGRGSRSDDEPRLQHPPAGSAQLSPGEPEKDLAEPTRIDAERAREDAEKARDEAVPFKADTNKVAATERVLDQCASRCPVSAPLASAPTDQTAGEVTSEIDAAGRATVCGRRAG
jgi:transcriptional regulator with XRE-family HTH domain